MHVKCGLGIVFFCFPDSRKLKGGLDMSLGVKP